MKKLKQLLPKIIAILATVAFASLAYGASLSAAPATGGEITPLGLPRDVWEFAKGAGPFGFVLMWYMWQRESNERRKLQSERNDLLERVVVGINTTSTALGEIRNLLNETLRSGFHHK